MSEPEFGRGRFLPPPKPLVPVIGGRHTNPLEDATRQARAPLQDVGHTLLTKLVEACNAQPGHEHYKIEGIADNGFAKMRMTITVDFKAKDLPGVG